MLTLWVKNLLISLIINSKYSLACSMAAWYNYVAFVIEVDCGQNIHEQGKHLETEV